MGKNIALVVGAFHKREVTEMIDEARKVALDLGLTVVEEVWVHGAYEKPLAIKRLLQRDDVHGVAVLGIIEKGETDHGLVMGHVVMRSIIDLQLTFMKPIGVGILGPGILPSQIPVRIRPYAREAVIATNMMLEEKTK